MSAGAFGQSTTSVDGLGNNALRMDVMRARNFTRQQGNQAMGQDREMDRASNYLPGSRPGGGGRQTIGDMYANRPQGMAPQGGGMSPGMEQIPQALHPLDAATQHLYNGIEGYTRAHVADQYYRMAGGDANKANQLMDQNGVQAPRYPVPAGMGAPSGGVSPGDQNLQQQAVDYLRQRSGQQQGAFNPGGSGGVPAGINPSVGINPGLSQSTPMGSPSTLQNVSAGMSSNFNQATGAGGGFNPMVEGKDQATADLYGRLGQGSPAQAMQQRIGSVNAGIQADWQARQPAPIQPESQQSFGARANALQARMGTPAGMAPPSAPPGAAGPGTGGPASTQTPGSVGEWLQQNYHPAQPLSGAWQPGMGPFATSGAGPQIPGPHMQPGATTAQQGATPITPQMAGIPSGMAPGATSAQQGASSAQAPRMSDFPGAAYSMNPLQYQGVQNSLNYGQNVGQSALAPWNASQGTRAQGEGVGAGAQAQGAGMGALRQAQAAVQTPDNQQRPATPAKAAPEPKIAKYSTAQQKQPTADHIKILQAGKDDPMVQVQFDQAFGEGAHKHFLGK